MPGGSKELLDPSGILYGDDTLRIHGLEELPDYPIPMAEQLDPLELYLNNGYFEQVGPGPLGYSGTAHWIAQGNKIPEKWLQAEPQLPSKDKSDTTAWEVGTTIREIFDEHRRLDQMPRVEDFREIKRRGCRTQILATLEDGRDVVVHSNPNWLAAVEEMAEWTGYWYLREPADDKNPWEDDPSSWVYANSAKHPWGWVDRVDFGRKRKVYKSKR